MEVLELKTLQYGSPRVKEHCIMEFFELKNTAILK